MIKAKNYIISCMLLYLAVTGHAQCLPENMVITEGSVPIMPSYTLSKPNGVAESTIGYCPEYYTPEFGASYLLIFQDQGGMGMDGYPCIKAGGAQYNNTWHPGDYSITGMPVQLKDIPSEMNFELTYHQEEALDDNDKWMASVNFIFDIYGTKESKPLTEQRDFDLVVKAQSHNFNDALHDQPTPVNTRFWFYARNSDGSLKTYDVEIDDILYSYAVRYKFFEGAGDKDNKVQMKFIPVGPSGAPPVMKINVKEILHVSKAYIEFAALPEEQRLLAENNISGPETWLKGINAGYEVYTGESLLRIDKFKVYPNGIPSNTFSKILEEKSVNLYPMPFRDFLKWKEKDLKLNQALFYDNNNRVFPAPIHKDRIDTQELPAGVYILHLIEGNEHTILRKAIKF